jgi:predicted nucleic acid-binding protein
MERPTALVLDASVVVKWFVPEADSPEALSIRDAHANQQISLFAPDLLVYELANALRHRPSLGGEDLKASLESFFEMDLALIAPTAKSASRGAALAKTFDLTVYDASYLGLAQDLDCRLVTSDETFCEKVLAVSPDESSRVVLLKDYSKEQEKGAGQGSEAGERKR